MLLTRADSRAAGGLVGTLLTMSDEAMARTRRGGRREASSEGAKNSRCADRTGGCAR